MEACVGRVVRSGWRSECGAGTGAVAVFFVLFLIVLIVCGQLDLRQESQHSDFDKEIDISLVVPLPDLPDLAQIGSQSSSEDWIFL